MTLTWFLSFGTTLAGVPTLARLHLVSRLRPAVVRSYCRF
jgi:hypothetical protein